MTTITMSTEELKYIHLIILSKHYQNSNFYDLLLVDINMPHINGFELSEKILAIDSNVKVCFMSSAEIHREALGEIYPAISIGCFIRKPVGIDYLVKRIMSELD